MLDKMAKEIKVEPPKERKNSFFPRFMLLYGLVITILAVVSLIKLVDFQKIVFEILLIVGGLWLIKVGFERGFYRRRKEILKKYI